MISLLYRRLRQQRGLAAALIAGMLVVIALGAAIPLYTDAVHYQLLQTRLQKGNKRPPFAFLFRYVGEWYGSITWERYRSVDAYLRERASETIGLPRRLSVRYVRTEKMQVFPEDENGYQPDKPLFWTNLAFLSPLAGHIRLVDGKFPAGASPGGAVPVLVSQEQADETGMQVGERYWLRRPGGTPLVVRVAGIWQPSNEADPFWFYAPGAFRGALLTTGQDFEKLVVPHLKKPVGEAVWYTIFDGSRVRGGRVTGLLRRIDRVMARSGALLPHVSLDASPKEALEAYRREARDLAERLTLFSLPVFGILFTFLALVGDALGRRRQNEIAVLRSRGVTRLQIVVLQAGEGGLAGLAALPLGLLLAGTLARRLGAMRYFLDPAFVTASRSLPIRYDLTSLSFALGAFLVSILAVALPAWSASRHTVVSYKQEQARQLRPPLWQRLYLDLLLFVPALYGYYLLRERDVRSRGADLFRNPFLFLVPTLFVLALTLATVRLFPWFMRAAAALLARLPGSSLLLAFRHLARSPAASVAPLTLLVLTLGLSTFTASMASTLDRHLYQAVYYRVGADMRLVEMGESAKTYPAGGRPAPGKTGGAVWLFLPVSEHLRIPGVLAAARVGNFPAQVLLGGDQETGRVLGVERVDFQRVAFFRPDFADGQPLGALMNLLAEDPMDILVQRQFMERHGLRVGDPLSLLVQSSGREGQATFTIVGDFDLFPTTYPDQGPIFVTHLDTLFQLLGGEMPYDVWLRLAPGVSGQEVVSGVRNLGIQVVTAEDARSEIREAQEEPARQGVFGILSAGFLAAAFLTVLGFVIFAFLSFRRRYVELGVLRALGLSQSQMALSMAAEQAVLLLAGVGAGTGVGVATAYLFIPLLQTGSPVPPFLVRIAWKEIGIVVALFTISSGASVAMLVALLARLELFRAVKMGETV